MTFSELKDKANSLPYAPGVYIMRDKTDKVIYVGKAKKLKNRVSQYFQDTAAHSPKTKAMVAKIHHFDVIVAASEFEALVLECSLIKRYLPKYNILLKDDKGYPYLRLDTKELYPGISIVSKIQDDGASYFGPYGSRSVTHELIEAVKLTLKLPTCSKQFPRDIGKERPCLNYHMKQCDGWCRGEPNREEFLRRIDAAKQILQGNYRAVSEQVKQNMLDAAEALEFETAANLRDRLNAVEALGKKQLVTAVTLADTDVIGYGETEAKACFAVLHFSGGNLLDKDYEILNRPDDKHEAVSSLMKQYYLSRGLAPKIVLLPFDLEDKEDFSKLMEQQFGRVSKLRVPQRGDNMRLIELANKNAYEEAERVTGKEERVSATVTLLGKMLSMDPPKRIESFDISNISGSDIVSGMVVFEDGRPAKGEYKRFKIQGLGDQDDYASMHQTIQRRFQHYLAKDPGFDATPDLLLIDGGILHAQTACNALRELGISFPVFGMVKDDRHRTRALVTAEGEEIHIDANQAVFALIGNIQEETHRFAITYHRKLRSKRLRYSELDEIPGIGPKRKEDLLKHFKSLKGIGLASLMELESILPSKAAYEVFMYFQAKKKKEDLCE